VIDRLPPQNVDSEQAVLGSILIDRDAIVEVADFLRPDDFYRQAHGRIYAAMLGLFERRAPIDVVTVAEALGRAGELEAVGGPAYLSQLANDTPTAVHAEQYARIVERKALLRGLIGAAGQIAAIGYEDGSDVAESLDRAQSVLMAVCNRTASCWQSLGELLPGAYEHLSALHEASGALLGVPSGFSRLDRLTGGFMAGDLVILAARPSVGKSAMALQIASYAAMRGIGVGLMSLEMSAGQLALRVLAGGASIDTRARIPDTAFARAADLADELSGLPIWIEDTPTATPMELRTRARRLIASQPRLGLLVVDYLQLAHATHAETREREVAEVTRALKSLARELRIPVLALSQLSRQPESRDSGRPRLSDLRESGAIEQDADTVIFLWRPGREEDDVPTIEPVTMTLAKQRTGPSNVDIHLEFHRARTLFFERAREPYAGAL
jgi:replicative DNA helicase